ncbi:hypothetical protein KUV50_15850 [Membranicola marinus]|uniref:Uncharacterized protein n=1 Tax=Membranihabitans marinus TaxID=1227546 RepID=A0A953I1L5_9BACT|nr:hypothetical protein [Membranihabitans marinus]MBY5959627.1 hypothetical protein [Membranihabitans marinus]
MKLDFTLKLIPFIYHETTAQENAEIVHQILSDGASEDAFQEVLETKEMLDTVIIKPSKKSIDRILEYSRGTSDLI